VSADAARSYLEPRSWEVLSRGFWQELTNSIRECMGAIVFWLPRPHGIWQNELCDSVLCRSMSSFRAEVPARQEIRFRAHRATARVSEIYRCAAQFHGCRRHDRALQLDDLRRAAGWQW
jgi:hypothetical protein